ncbi:hypothetical protein CYMTET_39800 [Cymbomonas tetramitiformis]|uniref:EGF-like domain-containing protein n=1 Tax=Cymbomonas tetramitiformis TaxID=36881 RepID=A0AAE0CAK2_9CHLO|nr:hypothetical protein CYMTET_39800 [Cymbomonas tetramitiformis]
MKQAHIERLGPLPKTPKNCSEGCTDMGTCYEPLGRCDCPFGFSGEACETYQPPLYQAMYTGEGDDNARCGEYQLNCGAHQGRGYCRAGFCLCGAGFKGKECLKPEVTYCMGGCSCFGECEQGFCHCKPGHFGADCSLTMGPLNLPIRQRCNTVLDPNAKTEKKTRDHFVDAYPRHVFPLPANGTVRDSMSSNKTGALVNKPLLIYSCRLTADYAPGWPIPVDRKLHSMHPSLIYGRGVVGAAELFLWERFLASNHRTLDPEQADFFFVPTLSRPATGGWVGIVNKMKGWGDIKGSPQIGTSNMQYSGRWGNPGQYWRDVVEYISTEWPFWGRKGGADHLFVLPGDHGACDSPRGRGIPDAIRPAMMLTHWGNTFNPNCSHTRQGIKCQVAKKDWPYGDRGPCFRRHHDILIPPPQLGIMGGSPLRSPRYWASRMGHETYKRGEVYTIKERTLELFFLGDPAWEHQKIGDVDISQGNMSRAMYSHGVRQKMYELWRGHPGFLFATTKWKHRPNLAAMATAKFCLVTTGTGFSNRLVISLGYGCVPVIIADHIVEAWEDDLPSELYSIRVAEADVNRLPDILARVTPSRYNLMHRAVECIYKRFQWSSIYGMFGVEDGTDDAFAMLMLALQNRRDYPGRRPPHLEVSQYGDNTFATAVNQLCTQMPILDPRGPTRLTHQDKRRRVPDEDAPKKSNNTLCRAYNAGSLWTDGEWDKHHQACQHRGGKRCCRVSVAQPDWQPWFPGGAMRS